MLPITVMNPTGEHPHMAEDDIVDTSTSEFAKRLAASLRVARERRKLSIEELAMRSAGA